MSEEQRLKKVLSDVMGISSDAVNEDTSVDTVKEWDSLNHMKLVLALEGEFNISLTEEQTVEIINYPLIRSVLSEHGISV
jgi:acyl carrier protein